MHPRINEKIVFQIGLDRCGTTSLFMLFHESGYPSAHWRHENKSLFGYIQNNIINRVDPLEGLDGVKFFSDMKEIVPVSGRQEFRNGFRFFPILEKWYPEARFILNTRPKENWIKSKLGISGGSLDPDEQKKLLSKAHGMTIPDFMRYLERMYDLHYGEARSYFVRDIKHKMFEFDIENDDINSLVSWLKPDFNLNAEYWRHHNQGP